MAPNSVSETKRVRYLLGLCSQAEREHIESQFFEYDDAFQELLTAEDDLIDAYAHGGLVGEERRRFEKSFMGSLRGRKRVQFARAFGATISTTSPVETKLLSTLLNIVQFPSLSRTGTIAGIIVFVAMLAWSVSDRRRMASELRELRAESAELNKRTEILRRNSDTERIRAASIAAQLADLRAQADKPAHSEVGTTATLRARHMAEVKNDREIASSKPEQDLLPLQLATSRHGNRAGGHTHQANVTLDGISADPRNIYSLMLRNMSSSGGTTVRGTVTDPSGNFVSGATVTLADCARRFTRTQSTIEDGAFVFDAIPPGTYSLKVKAPGFKTASASGLVAVVDTPAVRDVQLELGAVSETVDVTLAAETAINTSDATLGNSFERKRITELPLNANNVVGLLSLQPGVSRTGFVNGERADQSNITLEGVDATVRIPSLLSWIKFQIAFETAVIHEEYSLTIKTADGNPVRSVNWTEPLAPNLIIIDTPVISIQDLPSGDYMLLLMGKEVDGSFVKVAEYSFKVIKY